MINFYAFIEASKYILIYFLITYIFNIIYMKNYEKKLIDYLSNKILKIYKIFYAVIEHIWLTAKFKKIFGGYLCYLQLKIDTLNRFVLLRWMKMLFEHFIGLIIYFIESIVNKSNFESALYILVTGSITVILFLIIPNLWQNSYINRLFLPDWKLILIFFILFWPTRGYFNSTLFSRICDGECAWGIVKRGIKK